MPEKLSPQAQRWARLLQDALATDSAIREGLQDADAIPFMEWGRAQAERVAARWAAQGLAPSEEQLDEAAAALLELMTNVNWVVRYRHKKGTAWLVNMLRSLNALSRELFGQNAPVLGEETIAAWVRKDVPGRDGEALRALLAHLTPAQKPPTAPPLPGRPPQGPASALGHNTETPHTSGLLGDLAKRIADASKSALGSALSQKPQAPHPNPPAQALGKPPRRAPQKKNDEGPNASEAESDANTATPSGEDHD